ncbi:MAG: prepilin-type N-terminal cleavage/methylation domain-containing protein [Candidatus Magnetomorum sp.]|nr:prepilin-type N-terminal cleavage/methylation domain-containing protein [Candidatus Magnetomorum sp.]
MKKIFLNGPGFTLIELIVVMAIMSILATIGVYSFNAYLPRHRQLAAARVVAGDLSKARIRAIKQKTDQNFHLNMNTYTIGDGTVTFIDRDFARDFDWNDLRIQTAREPTFNMNGTIDNISTITIMCGDSDPLEITMTITGNIKIR